MSKHSQQCFLTYLNPSHTHANAPWTTSAHPSHGEAVDWPPRTAPHNNSLCMVTVTEEGKLLNPPRYNLLKITAIKNPHRSVCVRACVHVCARVCVHALTYQSGLCECSRATDRVMERKGLIWQRLWLTDGLTDTLNGWVIIWLIYSPPPVST